MKQADWAIGQPPLRRLRRYALVAQKPDLSRNGVAGGARRGMARQSQVSEDRWMAEHNEKELGTSIMPVTGLVPMISVQDVERAVEFYKLLGFAVGNRVPRQGRMNWAWLYAPHAPDWRRGPNLMLSRAEREIDSVAKGVLFYLYATDLVGLRSELMSAGKDPGPIKYPEYLPKGEFALQDPDGYRLMVAQSDDDTP